MLLTEGDIDPSTLNYRDRIEYFRRQFEAPPPPRRRKPYKPPSGIGGELFIMILGGIAGFFLFGGVGAVPFLLICILLAIQSR